jgi:16S rRNA (cytosine967-C5)-methyltransferase
MDINRKTAFLCLADIEKNASYSNIALNRAIRENRATDHAFVRELVYGVIKNKYLLDHYLRQFIKKGFSGLRINELCILRMGAYQIIFMGSVPGYAACSETVELAKAFAKGKTGFINGVLRSLERGKDSLKEPSDKDPVEYLSIKYSVEKWIADLLINIYGYEKAGLYLKAVNESPKLCLRVNLLKGDRESLIKELTEEGFEVIPSEISDRSIIAKGSGILDTEAFRNGKFAVQDQASTLVADTLDAGSGMTAADMCAAPGGKTAAVAESMNNEGEIYAFDIYEHKLKLMDELFRRNGITIVKTAIGDAREAVCDLIGNCDRVLCDVPCSGLGVLGRKPEIKYRKEFDFTDLINTQKQIIDNLSQYVKKGGALVYSTCTVNPAENTEVTSYFLDNHPGFKKEKEICLDPVDTGTDGFYICKLIREA